VHHARCALQRCAYVWASCSRHRSTQVGKSCRGCSRPGSPSASCSLCAMRLRLGKSCRGPPWEPERVVPAVRDAPAFGQPARSAVRCRSASRVAAAPALGARARRARCARCDCVWATCSQRRSTQVGKSCRGPPWEPERVVPALRDAPASGQSARSAVRCRSAKSCRGCSRPGPRTSCPAVRDAPAFGQPARGAARRRSRALRADRRRGYAVAVSALEAPPARCARCAQCGCAWPRYRLSIRSQDAVREEL
jgi:hypothetical protein